MSKQKFKDMIAYEIYPTSFYDQNDDGIGDLNGIRAKLGYLQKMGFNAIWLNPFYKSPFRDGGYDVTDFFAVDSRFGTMKDFEKLIKKAHSLKIRIIIDLVEGHASMDNPDFLESAKAERNEKSDLFIWSDNPWERSEGLINGMYDRHGSYMVNFFAHQPAFNYGFNRIDHPSWQLSYKDKRTFAAREYMLKVMRFWLNKGVDGFRVDMADSLVKNDEDKSATIEVWKWLFKKIRKDYPEVFFVSEWSDPKRAFKAGFDADFVLDHWDNFYHRFFRSDPSTRGTALIKGGSEIEYALNDMRERFKAAKENKAYLALISGNHDTWRIANYLDHKQLKAFYLLLFSLPGIPFILYGDEIGMKTANLASKDGGYQRTGTRIPMIWDESTPHHGFTNSKETYLPFDPLNTVSVKEAKKDKDSIYHFICRLIELRKKIRDLSDPDLEIKEEKRVLFFDRKKYQLIINLSDKDYPVDREIIISTDDTENAVAKGQAALIRK